MYFKLFLTICFLTKPVYLNSKNQSVEKSENVLHQKTFSECKIVQNSTSINKSLESASILFGLLSSAIKRTTLVTKCDQELKRMHDGILERETWALKALDASAMPGSGFVLGQNFLLGSVRGCAAVQEPHIVTISNRFKRHMRSDLLTAVAPIETDYRVVYAEHQSPLQIQVEFTLDKRKILHIGLCVPKSCSDEVISNLTQSYLDSSRIQGRNAIEYNANVIGAKDLNTDTIYADKLGFRILGFWILFTFLFGLSAYGSAEIGRSGDADTTTNEQSYSDCFIKSFSIRDNLKRLFSVEKPKDAVPAVDGLKSIGCIVILVFHVCYFGNFAVENSATMFSHGEQIYWQWIGTAPIIVDAFFTISGFLLTYNFFRNQKRIDEIRTNSFNQNLKLFGKQLLNRYLRLTPLYLATIAAMEILTAYLVDASVFWIHDRNDLTCGNYWWRNLLYIQNLFDFNDLCLVWSWSLACEMQFFVLVTVLLFLYTKNPDLAKKLFCGLFIVSTISLYIISKIIRLTPAYDVMHSLWNEFYMPPWMRVVPYLVGVSAGYLNFKLNGKLDLTKENQKQLWIGAAIVIIITHTCTIFRTLTPLSAVPIITCIRIFYPASISWIIIASHTGYGGPLAHLLNASIFIHLNKLSYAIYLLNPFIIAIVFGFREHSVHFNVVTWAVLTTGTIVIVYFTAIVFSVLFEMPYSHLATKLFKTNVKIPKQQTNVSELISDKKPFVRRHAY